MLFRFVIFSLLALSYLPAEQEIRVELSTKAELAPLYLSRLQGENSSFEASYLKELRALLHFDLSHSGFARLAETDHVLEKALYQQDPNVVFSSQRWVKGGIRYVVKGVIEDKKLQIFAFNAKSGVLKKFEDISLSGDLSQDRKQIHRVSDAIVKALFGVEGIADSRILYSIQTTNADPENKDWKAEIWECEWDGNNPRQITYEHSYSISPVFIPAHPTLGSDRYLYVNYKNGQPKIYFSSLKNKTGKPLLTLRGNQLLPAVSKQRDKLAFICDATGRTDLFIQKIDDTGALIDKPEQLFSYPRSTQASPCFSPNGKRVAFVSDKDGTPRIYVISSKAENSKRPNPQLLTKINKENTCPAWSPDGTKLAYSAKTNGVRQIWIYDFKAEEEKQLTAGPGNKENPAWAPDSLHLVFNSTDPDSSELYLINLNQPQAVKITNGPGRKHYPTWGSK